MDPEITIGLPYDVLSTPDVDIWDIDQDGQRFLGVLRPEEPDITQIHVVLNFAEELRRLDTAD